MPRVFTVYNCGTGFDRTHTEELIAKLATITQGAENRDWMINDGVGSHKVKFNRLTATPEQIRLHDMARLPGSRSTQKAIQQGFTAVNGEARHGTKFFPWIRGTVNGHGWEHNVDHAMDVITSQIMASNVPPAVINMAGWSRGAITCIMLAHALYKEPSTRNLQVNIFAADPVAGPGNRVDIDKNTLPPNVHRYLGVMQQHEARGLFKPTSIKNFVDVTLDIKDKILPMPGVHNTGVITGKTDVGIITASLAHHFLMKHGTQLRNPVVLSSLQICELYACIRRKHKKYEKMSFNFQRILGTHKRTNHAFSVSGAGTDDYFINEHHIKHFRQTFPISCQRLHGMVFNPKQAQDECARMSRQAPETYRSLEIINAVS